MKRRLPRQVRRLLRRSGLPREVRRALGRVAAKYLAGDPAVVEWVKAVIVLS